MSIVFFLVIFSVNCSATIPTPFCYILMELATHPQPLTPVIYSLPSQQAQANSFFKFNVKRFIGVSRPEVVYRLTNISSDREGTTKILGSIMGVSGLPIGVVQLDNRPDDCSPQSSLGKRESCLLRFYFDTNYDPSLISGTGPIISAHISWAWGSHKNRDGGQNLSVTPNDASSHLSYVLAPIVLPTHIHVTPLSQAGLYYNPDTSSIEGYPTKTGQYIFTINATNGSAIAAPQTLVISVNINPHDTPVFKSNYTFASATPGHMYRLNLMDLIEQTPEFTVTNQISFKLAPNRTYPQWLTIDKNNATLLAGYVPAYEAGTVKEVTIIATSNTGGPSQPLTIKIPVAFDPDKKPIIENGLELSGAAGALVDYDFRSNITDPTLDANLRLILYKVEPTAPWLSMSSENPTLLTGRIPSDAMGQRFQLSFYANTLTGGNSASVTIPLNIAIDERLKPSFKQGSPQLPFLYPGQPFLYDFVEHDDVSPADIPYRVELAREYDNPEWLRITDNKLIADEVPNDLTKDQIIFIKIRNIPGGESGVFTFSLAIR